MPFYPPEWVPKLPQDPPDSVSIPDFLFDDKYGRHPIHHARNPFTCGLTGLTYTQAQVLQRIDHLARGLQEELGWEANKGTEWDKIAGVFSLNTVDTNTLGWAIQKLGGICSPANAAYAQYELEHQMRDAGATCLFTCLPLLDMTLATAQKLGIPKERVYVLELPKVVTGNLKLPSGVKTVNDLIEIGSSAPKIEPLNWSKGEGARRVAFLCYSSGTSGLPKGVMISHRNVISNVMQMATYDSVYRGTLRKPGDNYKYQENGLGLLPMSHIYGLVVVCHLSVYNGDGVIVLPKFELASCMSAIQNHKINTLFIVPPILILMAKNKKALDKYDLSSVLSVFTGAAPLGSETAMELQSQYPNWKIRQGYGLTETCTVVTSSSPLDIWFGSSGSIVPGFECKVIDAEGNEVTGYDQPGELLAKSPSVVLGYLNNEKATKETFVGGFMRTGDEVVIKKSPNGYEHVFIVDRIKELIKVKGLQVAPAELEAHLLTHPAVADCAVIPMPDESAGERPKAFVVKSSNAGGLEDSERLLMRDIRKHVEAHKARHKWLAEVEFIDVIPKSPSGKILRRLLRDQDKEKRRKAGAKL